MKLVCVSLKLYFEVRCVCFGFPLNNEIVLIDFSLSVDFFLIMCGGGVWIYVGFPRPFLQVFLKNHVDFPDCGK